MLRVRQIEGHLHHTGWPFQVHRHLLGRRTGI